MKGAVLLLNLALVAAAQAQVNVPLWVNRHGLTNSSEAARAVAIDTNGNVFVTGAATGSNFYDYLTLAYSSAGALLWTNRYDGPEASDDQVMNLVVDEAGNVIVTGASYGIGSLFDYATVKYSGAGVPLWTNRYNGRYNDDDIPVALAVDSAGNVFVTGVSGTYQTAYATLGYSSSGVPLWTNRYDGSVGDNVAFAVAVDSGGNVIVTGSSGSDFATIKYSGAGVPLWTNRYNGPGNAGDSARAVAVNASGVVFVTGESAATSAIGSSGYATVAYSGAGVPLWTNRCQGVGNNGYPQAMALDGSGNVFVTGYAWGGLDFDYLTVAYSSMGVALWTNRYNGGSDDVANAVKVDAKGNVFVTGYSAGNESGFDYATVAYSSTGALLWTHRYNGPGNGEDEAKAIAVDASGNVFVTGHSLGIGGYYDGDFATIKYAPTFPPVQLNAVKLNDKLVLSWTNTAFGLQTAPSVSGLFTNVAGATSPYTNTMTGVQQFFRLKSN